jgi:phosphoheptose isomerase
MNSFNEYFDEVKKAVASIDHIAMERAFNQIDATIQDGGRIFLMGNGGSAAICDHWVCDYMKGIYTDTTNPVPEAISLTSNGPLITAIANDLGYEKVFSQQLMYHRLGYKDLVIAVSVSGNSPNILNALKTAGPYASVIVLVGANGGSVGPHNYNAKIHVKSDNYGVCEDVFMMILHSFSQRIRYRDARDRSTLKL